MKRIGLTQRVIVDGVHAERRDALDQRWVFFAEAVGFMPVPIPNRLEHLTLFVEAMQLEGAVLTGGGDLTAYGGDAVEREAVERGLLDRATKHDFPVLGICRGLQMIQHYFGGRLERINGHVGEPSWVVWNGSRRAVNSYHHFGIRHLAPELVPVAVASDGTIEAARHGTRPIVGMMWHPERCDPFCPEDIKFFRKFFRIE